MISPMPRRCLVGLACLVLTACFVPGRPTTASPAAVKTHDAGSVACPDGKSARAGLANFGAYIGSWQNAHRRDPQASSGYVIGTIPGRVVVNCSNDDYVIAEAISPRSHVPAGLALRLALSDLPDDAAKVYEHAHTRCHVLQYQSTKLAQQLGPDDIDGRATIIFESQASTYNAAAVNLILIDVIDTLGEDTTGC